MCQSITALAPGWQPKSSSTCSWWLPTAQAHTFGTLCWELDSPTDTSLKSRALFNSTKNCLCSPDQPLTQFAAWLHKDASQHSWGSKIPLMGWSRDLLQSCQAFCHDPVNWALHWFSYPQLRISFPFCTALFGVTCITHCWNYFPSFSVLCPLCTWNIWPKIIWDSPGC